MPSNPSTWRFPILIIVLVVTALAGEVASAADNPDAALVEQGRYLAIAGDCAACHTAPGGKPMAGGVAIATPIGSIISTNITPSKTSGIGNYSLEEFSAALRRGVRADGQRLYPAMPYTSYAKITDADVKALYAYFMHGVETVDHKPPETRLPFPFNIRLAMMAWNWLFLDTRPYAPDPAKDAEWNRGAYLTIGLAHCDDCHTPRNILMAEQNSRLLGGAELGAWFAPNITSDADSGIGAWSVDNLVRYMRDGHASGVAQAAGPMAEAIDNSLRYLTEEDLRAIAVYLKTVPAVHDSADTKPPFAWGTAGDALSTIRGVAVPADRDQWSGARLYDAYCATCHQAQGQGSFDGGLPSLFHNTTLGRANTSNLVMAILDGVHRQPDVDMPGFANELSDRQVATLSSYLIQRFGNPSGSVTVDQVKTARAGGPSGNWLVLAARLVIGIVVLILVAVPIIALIRRRRSVSV
ncbi:MAG: c-type cytochrome [Alphaproteobacteria bacterium]|nr:c-type cytochrome [Alphaproteobacteria bacterium]